MRAIDVSHVWKHYRTGAGITDVTLSVEPGEVYGFLGPNGSGKSTTIRLLLDLIRPDAGRIRVLGLDPRADGLELRRRLGYLPGELSLYERMTPRGLLDHVAALRGGLPVAAGSLSIDELAERLSLDLDRDIRELSRGNKQKVGLVQALMGRPDVVILDEPTGGLDPLVQRTVHELLAELRHRGCAVLLSSHVLSEVSRVADRVGILRAGRMVATESVAALHERAVHRIEVRTTEPLTTAAFAGVPGVTVVAHGGGVTHLDVTGRIDPVVKVLAGFEVIELVVGEPDLEELFLAFYDPAEEATRVAA